MIPYTFNQLLFFFFCYCVVGWIIESTYVSVKNRRLTNRGFMRGPVIPIYGCGAMVMLLVGTPLLKWPVLVFFAGMLAASTLEYFTGMIMEAIFKVRYWDYSDQRFNLNGYICLGTSLCWGALSIVLDYFLHRPVAALSELLSDTALECTVDVISVLFIVDFTLSVKAALDLRALVIKMEDVKNDLRIMNKRLDVILAYAHEDRMENRERIGDSFDELQRNVEEGLRRLKQAIAEKPEQFADNVKEEYLEFAEKLAARKDGNFGLQNFKDFYKRGIFAGNPTLKSKKFKDSLETIKKYVYEKTGRDEKEE